MRHVGGFDPYREPDPCREPENDAQRMDALARLSAVVAHDFNNALAVIFGYTEILLDDARDDATRASLREVAGAAERAMELSRLLLLYGRRQLPQLVPLPVAETLHRIEPALRDALAPAVQLVVDVPADAGSALAAAEHLEGALLDLAAFVRGSGAGTARLQARTGGGCVVLTLADDGPPLGADVVKRLFEPFYTAKVVRRGEGLGLAGVYATLRQMGGHATVASGPGGTTFELVLRAA